MQFLIIFPRMGGRQTPNSPRVVSQVTALSGVRFYNHGSHRIMNSAGPRHAINPWIVTAAVMLATLMEILDTTVVNVAVPHIAGNMGATVEEGTWVVTSYLVSSAIILPKSEWLANRFGRRRILLTCVAGFTLTSLLCGMATSMDALIFFRILQGLTRGGLQPLAQAALLETFPPKQHGSAMAAFGLGIILAPILGPCSAAGSPTTTPGAGFSISTFPWVSSRCS
jgi:MFS family permease